MEQLYRFVKATEDNLPEDGAIVIRYKYTNGSPWINTQESSETIRLWLEKKWIIEFLQQVTIPDDWADLYADFHHGDKTEANRAVWEDERENFIGGMNYIKSNLLAPLKGEDRNDIDTGNSIS